MARNNKNWNEVCIMKIYSISLSDALNFYDFKVRNDK